MNFEELVDETKLTEEYDNFIGVTEPYQKSNNIPLILNTGKDSMDKCSRKLFEVSLSFLQKIIN